MSEGDIDPIPIYCPGEIKPGHLATAICSSYGPVLRLCTTVPAEGKFVVIVPVLDYWRLVRANTQNQGLPHFSDQVSPDIIPRLKDDARIVFDLSNEGPFYDEGTFHELEEWLQMHSIPSDRVAFVSQNRALGAQYRAHHRPQSMSFFTFDFFVLHTYFACQMFAKQADAEASRDDHVNAQTGVGDSPTYPFLCFNFAPHAHRILLMLYLLATGNLDKGLVSFAGLSTEKGDFVDETAAELRTWGGDIPELLEWLPELQARGRMIIDEATRGGNDLAFALNSDPYARAYTEIVSETNFDDGSLRRVTEKSIKPMLFEKPFVILGNPLSLAMLRELGFQSFHPYIDEAYDEVADRGLRFHLVVEQVGLLARKSHEELVQLRRDTAEICRFNRQYLLGSATDRYYQLYASPLLNWMRRP